MGLNGDEARFSWTVDPTTPVSTLYFAGEIDLRASEATTELLQALPRAATGVLLDMAKVSFIDSSGLRSLVTIKQELEARSSRLFITRPPRPVTQLFDIAGVSTFFEFADGRRKNWWCAFKEARLRKRNGIARP